MKKVVLIVCVILLASAFLSAQDYKGKARVNGVVTDEQGKPIEGVRVKLFCIKANEGFELKTDKDGKWVGAWLRGGDWNADFDKIGYEPKKIMFNINENKKNPDVGLTMKKVEGLVVTDEIKGQLIKGNDLYDQKKYDEALVVYQDIVTKFPDVYPIYRSIGNCYFSLEKYDLAEQNYMKVLEKDPKNVQAILAIGNCYTNRGDAAKALEWYGKVDFEKIDDAVVLYNLGTSYFNNGKFEDALKCYLKAVEKQKDFTDGIYQLGVTYTSLQKTAEAIAAFESYLKIDPDSPRAEQVKKFLEYLRKK
ncbi:MAG: tetratricopeptide repeat protein [Candidatus Aminicenantales bacterium]